MRRNKLLLLGAAVLIVAGAVVWSFRNLGFWLVAEDPLVHAQAIFILAGDPPFRAMEAATIYHQGWAPEVWLAPDGRRRRDLALAELGLEYPGERESNRAVLIKLGVPESAIRTLDTPVWYTYDEVSAAASHLARTGGTTLIIATSQYHTRRVKLLWKKLAAPEQKLVVRPDWRNGFHAGSWWRNSSDALSVVREAMGIFNASFGSPVRTRQN